MINQMTPQEAKPFIDSNEAVFVDIRDGNSYAQSHIQGALSLNSENIDNFVQNTDKNQTVICYCYHGISSLHAAEYFLECGFRKVYSLSGGFEAWEQSEAESNAKIDGH